MTPQEQQRNEDRISALEKGQAAILDLLKPISETYRTVSLLGKWVTAFAVFISIVLGIIFSATKLFNK